MELASLHGDDAGIRRLPGCRARPDQERRDRVTCRVGIIRTGIIVSGITIIPIGVAPPATPAPERQTVREQAAAEEEAIVPIEAAKAAKAITSIEKSTIKVAHCHAPASKPGAETAKVAAAATTTSAERQSWPARDQSRAEHGRCQQYTKAPH
jgi:hypothetical protein